MLNLGTVRPGSTIYIPFETFAGATGAPITITNLVVGDIKVYKDGSTTERASTSGYTLLDTDGIDFDNITGIHGFSISLADNTTAGFWAAGSRYFVVVSTITVDSQTVSFLAARFEIGYPQAILNTTIATLTSQTSFTLTAGPAEDDALNGMELLIHDVASAVQVGRAVVLDYTGSTRTVTLAAGVTGWTAAATDNVSVLGSAPLQPTITGRTLNVSAAGNGDAILANSVTHGGSLAKLRLGTTDGVLPVHISTTRGDLPAVFIEKTATSETGNAGVVRVTGPGVGLYLYGANYPIMCEGNSANSISADLDGKILGGGSGTITGTGTRADVRAWNGTAPNNLQSGRIDSYLAAAGLQSDAVDKIWVKTMTELAAVPGVTASVLEALEWIFLMARNKITQTATTQTLRNDADNATIGTATVSDNGTTFTRGEFS